jgi:hypothetical protein
VTVHARGVPRNLQDVMSLHGTITGSDKPCDPFFAEKLTRGDGQRRFFTDILNVVPARNVFKYCFCGAFL